jgi:hypothetical protein
MQWRRTLAPLASVSKNLSGIKSILGTERQALLSEISITVQSTGDVPSLKWIVPGRVTTLRGSFGGFIRRTRHHGVDRRERCSVDIRNRWHCVVEV